MLFVQETCVVVYTVKPVMIRQLLTVDELSLASWVSQRARSPGWEQE